MKKGSPVLQCTSNLVKPRMFISAEKQQYDLHEGFQLLEYWIELIAKISPHMSFVSPRKCISLGLALHLDKGLFIRTGPFTI